MNSDSDSPGSPHLFLDDLKLAPNEAAEKYQRRQFVVVGSASIIPSLNAENQDHKLLVRSEDIDLFTIRKLTPPEFEAGDASLGVFSQFHQEHGFYIERLGDWVLFTQPEGWKERAHLIKQQSPTGQTITAYCLHPLDLAYNKIEAGREKDLQFIASLIKENIISLTAIESFIKTNAPKSPNQTTLSKNLATLKDAYLS